MMQFKTQAEELNWKIGQYRRQQQKAVAAGNIKLWREYADKEEEARTILYNIK